MITNEKEREHIQAYQQVTRFTEIKAQPWMTQGLRWDLDFLFACVKSILIHPIDARKQKVKYDRSKNKRFHAFNTTVEQILKYEKLAPFLKAKSLPLQTGLQDRAVLSCDHHALLFTSFVRYLGIPVRTRTGFSRYIVKGMLIPHWITEIFEPASGMWILVDPEQGIKSVNREDFLFAGQAWKFFESNPKLRIPSYSGLRGKQGLKYALISDLNCMFRNELMGYEWRLKTFHKRKPDILRRSYERLSPEQQCDIQRLAGLLLNPDRNMQELQAWYRKHIGMPELLSSVS